MVPGWPGSWGPPWNHLVSLQVSLRVTGFLQKTADGFSCHFSHLFSSFSIHFFLLFIYYSISSCSLQTRQDYEKGLEELMLELEEMEHQTKQTQCLRCWSHDCAHLQKAIKRSFKLQQVIFNKKIMAQQDRDKSDRLQMEENKRWEEGLLEAARKAARKRTEEALAAMGGKSVFISLFCC
jgi:hypothetical protein